MSLSEASHRPPTLKVGAGAGVVAAEDAPAADAPAADALVVDALDVDAPCPPPCHQHVLQDVWGGECACFRFSLDCPA